MILYIKQTILFGSCYVVLSLIIGECHPFSLISMYDSFPESACTFYLSDTKGNLLPLKKYYRYSTGDLTHFYNAIGASKKWDQPLTLDQLRIIGETMMTELQKHSLTFVAESIQLHRVEYFLKNNSIHSNDIIIYETNN